MSYIFDLALKIERSARGIWVGEKKKPELSKPHIYEVQSTSGDSSENEDGKFNPRGGRIYLGKGWNFLALESHIRSEGLNIHSVKLLVVISSDYKAKKDAPILAKLYGNLTSSVIPPSKDGGISSLPRTESYSVAYVDRDLKKGEEVSLDVTEAVGEIINNKGYNFKGGISFVLSPMEDKTTPLSVYSSSARTKKENKPRMEIIYKL